uniref:Uncharacterized protein n=1 Tax=Calidris pygmaea TaxID=425635 RepID=A0A8C3KUH1_9CHAR
MVAAICAYPQLLGAGFLPEDAKRRAAQVLRHLQGGSPGTERWGGQPCHGGGGDMVARYLERRDGGTPSDPRCIVPCGGTAADVLTLVVDETAAVPTGVLVPVPGPPLLGGATGLAGAVAVPYPLAEERGWDVDGETVRRVLGQARERSHP